jgi:pantetheine-phosphate adenylyltransferase
MEHTPRIAVYAASLDPITNGHINIIERAARLYDKLIVVVAVDQNKKYTFTADERADMARDAVAHLPNVSVDICSGRYVVKMAADLKAGCIIRGLRNVGDMEMEDTLGEVNRKICPDIETVWMRCFPEFRHVSSSMVKSHIGVDPSWEEQVALSVPIVVAKKLKAMHILGKAKRHWANLMGMLGNPDPIESQMAFDTLVLEYQDGDKHYHNLGHIVAMLDELEMTPSYKNVAISLAVWFHDVVNNPKSNTNERQSILFMKQIVLLMGLQNGLVEKASELIRATTHKEEPKDSMGQIMVDLDLAIFGKSPAEFDRYEAAIRNEYAWVSDHAFAKERSKILQSFLDRPQIYYTDHFREKYEQAARENLSRSIEKLQKVLQSQ